MKAEKEKAEKDCANDIVREIASFPPDSSIQPYCNLVNTLYVLPVSGSFTKHRNIACVVQLRNTGERANYDTMRLAKQKRTESGAEIRVAKKKEKM